MKKSGFIAVLVVLSLLFTLIPVSASAESAPSEWAAEAVAEAIETGISCADADFTAPLLRGDFAEYACELLDKMDLITLQTPTEVFSNPFRDTNSQYVFTLFSEGIIKGESDVEFCPDDNITRAEAATILGRMVRFADIKETDAQITYSDVDDNAYYSAPLKAVTNAGIIRGKEDGTFDPNSPISAEELITALMRIKNAERDDGASYANICDTMKNLTSYKRGAGTGYDKTVADMLKSKLESYGYEVSAVPFEFTDSDFNKQLSSENIVAVKKANVSNPDILYISAHYDSVFTTMGANDNATGASALLEIARLLSGVSSDRELRIIFFGGEENLMQGSTAYCQSLSEDELSRSVGAVNIDMVGGIDCGETVFNTINGVDTALSKAINETNNKNYRMKTEGMSDHSAFSRVGIPATGISQDMCPVGYHTILDRMENVDVSVVQEVCQNVYNTVLEVLTAPEAQYSALAKESADYGKVHSVTRDMPVFFGMKLPFVESLLGISYDEIAPPVLLDDGSELHESTYIYNSLVWFENGVPFKTMFRYDTYDSLIDVNIKMQDAGYSQDEAIKMISAVYGEPVQDYGVYTWEYRDALKCIVLSPLEDGGYDVFIDCDRTQAPGKIVPVTDGKPDGTLTKREQAIWEAVKSVIPPEYLNHMSSIGFINDGLKGVTATTSMTDVDGKFDASKYALSVDIYDYTDEDGNYTEYNSLIHTIVHEFGHAVEYNNWNGTQIEGDEYGQQKLESATDLSLLKQFYDKFCKLDKDDIFITPLQYTDRFVSKYAASKASEDFPEVFAAFVLSDRSYNTSNADEQINWMYTVPTLVEMRDAIRSHMGLEE